MSAPEHLAYDVTDTFLRPCGHAHSKYKLHIPDTEVDGHEPLCDQYHGNGEVEWLTKPTSVFPPGFKPICKHCLDKVNV